MIKWKTMLSEEDKEKINTCYDYIQVIEAEKQIAEDAKNIQTLLDANQQLTEEIERLQEYHRLIATGLSEYEARGTIWPNTLTRGCPKCGNPDLKRHPDVGQPKEYSWMRCPKCAWSTRCSSPMPPPPDQCPPQDCENKDCSKCGFGGGK